MRSSGLQEAVISVFDIDRLLRPLVEVCGFSAVDLPDADPGQFAAWRVPPACTRIEQVLLIPRGAEAQRGSLRLVKFHGVEQRVMRSSQRSWDTGGIFDVDVFSADVDRLYRGLQRFGWTAMGEPVDYSEVHFSVRQVVALGPDGLALAVIQRYSPVIDGLDPSGATSPIFNSTQTVCDYEAATRFYLETLGWTPRLAFIIQGQAEPGADVLGLPMPQASDAVRQVAMFNPPGPAIGGVELIHNKSMSGRRFDEHCVAPNVGLLCLRFVVDDARSYADAITARGGELYAAPTAMGLAPYGEVTLFSVRSPEGAIIEFYSQ
jgi:predicted enzyme related to lactoylglutathione lyase